MLHFTIMGAPGSGKGTQGKRLVEHFGIPHVSTGEMLRDAVARQTDLGVMVQRRMEAGNLVPDHLVITLVEERLLAADTERGFILDGFPRTMPQVQAFEELLADRELVLDGVILMDVPEDVVVQRLCGRRVDPETGDVYNLNAAGEHPPPEIVSRLEHRHDDTEEVIRQRMATYKEATDPAVQYYDAAGKLIRIDGSGDPDAVFEELMRRLESVGKGN